MDLLKRVKITDVRSGCDKASCNFDFLTFLYENAGYGYRQRHSKRASAPKNFGTLALIQS